MIYKHIPRPFVKDQHKLYHKEVIEYPHKECECGCGVILIPHTTKLGYPYNECLAMFKKRRFFNRSHAQIWLWEKRQGEVIKGE